MSLDACPRLKQQLLGTRQAHWEVTTAVLVLLCALWAIEPHKLIHSTMAPATRILARLPRHAADNTA